jgi:hypothetical protein
LEVLQVRNIKFSLQSIRKVAMAGVAVAAGVAMTRPAAATPSGLINLPSTDIYEKGTIHLDIDYIRFLKDSGFKADDQLGAGVTYGLGPGTDRIFGRSEIGLDYNINRLAAAPSGLGKNLFFNAKTQLYNNDEQGLRATLGVFNVGDESSSYRPIYVNASKNFGEKVGRVHLGYIRTLANDINPGDEDAIQIAYERKITNKLLFLAEYATGDGPFGALGGSLAYYIDDRSAVQLAYSRLNSSAFPQRNFIYVGYDINFGSTGAAAPEPNAEGEARN